MINTKSESHCHSHGWLDSLAIGMSMICAVHCLLTPILIACLPIIATTFWVHENFHLWMILFVLPTTSAAIFMGCRKHKDKAVFLLSMIGLCLLVSIVIYEVTFHSDIILKEHVHCVRCMDKEGGSIFAASTLLNVLGGVFLASGHIRNYLLCRKSNCIHE